MADYNGWRNRETWLVNLHFGDSFEEIAREDFDPEEETVDGIADRYEQYLDEFIGEEVEGLSMFLSDYLDLGLIDWHELAQNVYDELMLEHENTF